MNKFNNSSSGLIIAAICGIGLLIFSFLVATPATGKEVLPTLTNDDPVTANLLSEIAFYENALSSKNLSDTDRRSLEAKLAYASRQATQRVQDLKNIGIELSSGIRKTEIVKLTLSPYPKGKATPQRVSGIMQAPDITIPQDRYLMNYKIKSLWIGPYQGQYIYVYSGAIFSDLNQGILTIQHDNPFTFAEIQAPGKTGGLKIISEINMVLTLETEKLDILYFDVLNQRFVSSPEEINQQPKVTPTPPSAYP